MYLHSAACPQRMDDAQAQSRAFSDRRSRAFIPYKNWAVEVNVPGLHVANCIYLWSKVSKSVCGLPLTNAKAAWLPN